MCSDIELLLIPTDTYLQIATELLVPRSLPSS
jgi:hypothetical protein